MLLRQTFDNLKPQDPETSKEPVLWSVDLKLTHVDWTPDATLIHFQGHYLNICDLDYKILHIEVQRAVKNKQEVPVGEFCLVEDVTSGHWFRGRVQSRTEDLFEVYLIDHGNILTVDAAYKPPVSSDLFSLPPKLVCGFFANILPFPHLLVDKYLLCLIGQSITGQVQGRLPYEVLVLEVPDINNDLVQHGFGRYVDTDTFLFLVETLTELRVERNQKSGIVTGLELSKGPELFTQTSVWTKYKDLLKCGGPQLVCGTRAKVRLTALLPGMMFFQMVSMDSDRRRMSERLALLCDPRKKERKCSMEKIGLLCSVKGKDGNWYRGFLLFRPGSSDTRVFFVDYGFFEPVSVDSIHRLPAEFLQTPVMAFPCSLSVNGQSEAPKPQLLGFLKSSLLGRVLEVEISRFDEEQHQYHLTVWDIEDGPVKELESAPNVALTGAEPTSEGHRLSASGGFRYRELVFGKTLKESVKAEGFQVNVDFQGFVVYFRNPSEFWIRTQKRNSEFEGMMAGIQSHFHQVKLTDEVLWNPELGARCCAMYERDRHFYRAVVTNRLVHGAEVLFIDFGNVEKVPHMLVKTIPEAFTDIPAFAIPCTLADVTLCDEFWAVSVCDVFQQAVNNKLLKVRVLQLKKTQLAVDLHDMDGGDGRSVAELLNTSNKSALQQDLNKTKRISLQEQQLSQRSRATDFVGTTKEGEEGSPENGRKASVTQTFKAPELRPGTILTVRCFSITSLSDFWCQSLDQASKLEVLMDKVQEYYSANVVAVQAGESCCVAQSPVDKKWYRGLVTEELDGLATVLLVDYGYTVQVEPQRLRAMKPEFLHLDRQAFRCCLHDPRTPEGLRVTSEGSPEACTLKSFILKCADGLRCHVVSQLNTENQGTYVVDLYDRQTQQRLLNRVIPRERLGMTEAADLSPESFVFSSFDLKPGMEVHVSVTHVSTQWELYCHLQGNAEILHRLEESLSTQSPDGTTAVTRPLCLAKYMDGNWYRAVVQSTPSLSHVSVFYVDYGNTHILEKSEVKSIQKECVGLLCTPMLALRFLLDSVPKDESSVEVEEWLKKVVLNKSARATILALNGSDSFSVKLFCDEINVNQKVKELVCERKRAASRDVVHVEVNKSNMKTAKHWNLKASNKPVPVKHKQKKLRPKQASMAAKAKGPWEGWNPTVGPAVKLPEKEFPDGFRAKCFVSHRESRSSFFLQLADDESAILKMGDDLNSVSPRCLSMWSRFLRVGDLVLAQYEEDGALYRSVLTSQEGHSTYWVEFVDYGNSALVKKEQMFPIPKDFLSVPRFSISCSLLDSCTPCDSAFKDDEPLMVEFVRQIGNTWKVKVQILEKDGGHSAPEETKGSPRHSGETAGTPRLSDTNGVADVTKNQMRISSVDMMKDPVDTFTPTVIKAKHEERGTLLSAVGFGRFYVRLTRTRTLLTCLEQHINLQSHMEDMLTCDRVEEGLKCSVRVQETLCQRAVVQRTFGETCEVFLRDHGVMTQVPTSSVVELSDELKGIPDFAVLCEMKSLEICRRESSEELWREAFKAAAEKEVELVFLEYNDLEHLWTVDIIGEPPFRFHGGDSSVSLKEEPRVAGAGKCSDPGALTVPVTLETHRLYSGVATAVSSPFDFIIVLQNSSRDFNKTPTTVDGNSRFPGDLESDKETSPHTLSVSCLLRGVRPLGRVSERWSDEAVGFFRHCLCRRRLQVFLRELLSDRRGVTDILVDGVHVAKKLVDGGHAEYTDVLFELRFLGPLRLPGGDEDPSHGVDSADDSEVSREKRCSSSLEL